MRLHRARGIVLLRDLPGGERARALPARHAGRRARGELVQVPRGFLPMGGRARKRAGRQARTSVFPGGDQPESEDWERWRSMSEAVLHMKLPKEPHQVDHVCRLARAQWKRGGAFVIEVPDRPVRRDAWKRLRSQVQGSSASQRLFRKRRLVSNVADQVRYQAADTDDLMVLYRAPVEQDPEQDFENTAAETYAIDLDNLEEIERGEEEAAAPEDPAGEEAVSSPPVREPTKQEKEAVEKLHRNLGHPSNSSLARTLKVSGAEEHVWRYAKTGFRCPACSSGVLPKPARPATIPKTFAPNVVVAIDLFEFPAWNGEGTDRYLNAICLGTNFQLVEKVRSKQPGAIWAALARGWARVLGFPQIILLDQGTEFLGEFRQNAHDMGVLVHCIGARAPYQNGRCERHGALFKTMLQKALWSCPPTSSEDFKLLLREVESAKNRLSDRSGFSPAQRMLGETPRTTGELLADEMVDVVLKGVSGEMEKRLQAKRAAQKAFAEVNTSQAVRKAMRARARTQRTFRPGDIIFVWRSWKAQGIKKQAWVGPGVAAECLCECQRQALARGKRTPPRRHLRGDARHRGSAPGLRRVEGPFQKARPCAWRGGGPHSGAQAPAGATRELRGPGASRRRSPRTTTTSGGGSGAAGAGTGSGRSHGRGARSDAGAAGP